jgi:casein kinase II subunit beta
MEQLADQDLFDNSSENLEFDGIAEGGWIQWFCSLEGNDFFVEMEEDFIRDSFNLFGLKQKFDPERYR